MREQAFRVYLFLLYKHVLSIYFLYKYNYYQYWIRTEKRKLYKYNYINFRVSERKTETAPFMFKTKIVYFSLVVWNAILKYQRTNRVVCSGFYTVTNSRLLKEISAMFHAEDQKWSNNFFLHGWLRVRHDKYYNPPVKVVLSINCILFIKWLKLSRFECFLPYGYSYYISNVLSSLF